MPLSFTTFQNLFSCEINRTITKKNQVLFHLHITQFPSVACYWPLVCWTVKQDVCQPKHIIVTGHCIVWLDKDATPYKVFWTGILSIVRATFSLNYFSLLWMSLKASQQRYDICAEEYKFELGFCHLNIFSTEKKSSRISWKAL